MSKNSSDYDANLALYLQEIAKIPLLTPEDEKHLARTIRSNELTVWVKLLSVNALLPEIWELAHSLRPDRVQDFPELPEVVSLSANDFLDKKSRAVLATSIQSLDEDQSILSTSLDRFRKLVYGEHLPAQLQCDEEELLALERARGTARRARERFVRSNLRLTVSIARRYRNRDLPLIDLVQEGNLGLIKAVHRFDQARGFRFSTYAHWWIRQAIERAVINRGRLIRLPVHIIEQRRVLKKAQQQLVGESGEEPTLEELSQLSGLDENRILELQATALGDALSLDEPMPDYPQRKLLDIIRDPEAPAIDDALIRENTAEKVRDLMKHLSETERDVLVKRFGLDGDDPLTLEEIGHQYGLSRERIRQIQVQGLQKMRRMCDRRKIGA
ncbi:MAG: sigma-70 family RNA polymerase sigma factor [Myxococcota bacterium]|nr:sigma-70 family RNA polymerase sigma factor [Myxococcota bacterium]